MTIGRYLFVFAIAILSTGMISKTKNKPFSPTDMSVNEKKNVLAIAGKTSNVILLVRLKDGKKLYDIETELPPTGVVFDKETLWATTSYSKGYLLSIDKKGQILTKTKVGHGACSPVVHPHQALMYVANQYSNDISVVDIKNHKETKRIKVLRQPMAQTISPDGKYLFVANLLPDGRADMDTVAASVSIIDTEKGEKIKDVQLANGSNALRDIKISPDGNYVFTSHNLGRFQVPTTQLVQGWMNTSAISIIDAGTLSYIATVLLDQPENGAAGSWGIDFSNTDIIVAHSGTHDFSKISYEKFIEKLLNYKEKEKLTYDLSFIQDIRERFPVSGNGPRDVLIVENQLYIANYFSDYIEIHDLNKPEKQSEQIVLNEGYAPDDIREGEIIFNDAAHCFQAWQSCNGCHPNDARTDGLNWDLLNDGIGNPKNCKSLLFSHYTPPAMITGIRPDGETAVRAGFKHIQFAQVDDEDAKKVDEYLKSLKPVPGPFLNDHGQLTENAKKGKDIFEKVSCNYCHSGQYYTDLKKHVIGQQGKYDFQNEWDTPTLLELWRSGPYLHDGRCATLKDVFLREKHGLKYDNLTEEEIDWLVEYVNSL